MNKEGFAPIFIIIAVAVVVTAIGVGGYLIATKKLTKMTGTVLSPAGGEQWPLGSRQIIKWSMPASISYVAIQLLGQSGAFNVFEAGPNTGSYSWVVGQANLIGAQIPTHGTNNYPGIKFDDSPKPGNYTIRVIGIAMGRIPIEIGNVSPYSAVSSPFTIVAASTTTTSTLAGVVSIGPICPVETLPPPLECMPSPEAYAAREFLVTQNGKTITSFRADPTGNYSISLAPGVYTIVSAKTGIGYASKDLPSVVTIKSGQTTMLDISIDTGIR
jgi:hypothetical protein